MKYEPVGFSIRTTNLRQGLSNAGTTPGCITGKYVSCKVELNLKVRNEMKSYLVQATC